MDRPKEENLLLELAFLKAIFHDRTKGSSESPYLVHGHI